MGLPIELRYIIPTIFQLHLFYESPENVLSEVTTLPPLYNIIRHFCWLIKQEMYIYFIYWMIIGLLCTKSIKMHYFKFFNFRSIVLLTRLKHYEWFTVIGIFLHWFNRTDIDSLLEICHSPKNMRWRLITEFPSSLTYVCLTLVFASIWLPPH